jgi:hypothetical protein
MTQEAARMASAERFKLQKLVEKFEVWLQSQ